MIFSSARAGIDADGQAVAGDDMHRTASDHGFIHVAELACQLTTIPSRGTLEDALRVLVAGLAAS